MERGGRKRRRELRGSEEESVKVTTMKESKFKILKPSSLLTLGETLVGQCNLTGQQIEAETTEDAAKRRDGDETVGGTRLEERETEEHGYGHRLLISESRRVWRLTLTNAAVFRE